MFFLSRYYSSKRSIFLVSHNKMLFHEVASTTKLDENKYEYTMFMKMSSILNESESLT